MWSGHTVYAFNSAIFDFFLASTKSIISHQWQYDIAMEKENMVSMVFLSKSQIVTEQPN